MGKAAQSDKGVGVAVAGVLALALSQAAAAHHSAAPHFDLVKTVEVSGTLTAFRFVNPHSYVYFDVTSEGGRTVPWRCELPARTTLARLGWTESLFVVGRHVAIKGSPARREDNVCYLESLTTDDGLRFGREQQVSRVPVAQAPTRQRLDDWGRPNMAGLWVAERRGPPGGGPPPRGLASAAGLQAAANFDQRFDDPAVHCSPANILFGWTHDENVNQVIQDKNTLTLKYGYMDLVRTIHLDQTTHPAKLEPTLGGHSMGHFEGDVLVVDTTGFAAGVLLPMLGLMHSEQLHVVERFSVDAATATLTREFRAEDPLYLRAPWTGRDMVRATGEPFKAFGCVELSGKNNQRAR